VAVVKHKDDARSPTGATCGTRLPFSIHGIAATSGGVRRWTGGRALVSSSTRLSGRRANLVNRTDEGRTGTFPRKRRTSTSHRALWSSFGTKSGSSRPLSRTPTAGSSACAACPN